MEDEVIELGSFFFFNTGVPSFEGAHSLSCPFRGQQAAGFLGLRWGWEEGPGAGKLKPTQLAVLTEIQLIFLNNLE